MLHNLRNHYKTDFLNTGILFYRWYAGILNLDFHYKFANAYVLMRNEGTILSSSYLGAMGIEKKKARMNNSVFKMFLNRFIDEKWDKVKYISKIRKLALHYYGYRKFFFRSVRKIRGKLNGDVKFKLRKNRKLIKRLRKKTKLLRIIKKKYNKRLKSKYKLIIICSLTSKKSFIPLLSLAHAKLNLTNQLSKASYKKYMEMANHQDTYVKMLNRYLKSKNYKNKKIMRILKVNKRYISKSKNFYKNILKKRNRLWRIFFESDLNHGRVFYRKRKAWNYV